MEMIPVQSSNIEAIGYDPETSRLRVRFNKRDSLYEYNDVPPEIFEAFRTSDSKGGFFQRNILRTFNGRKME